MWFLLKWRAIKVLKIKNYEIGDSIQQNYLFIIWEFWCFFMKELRILNFKITLTDIFETTIIKVFKNNLLIIDFILIGF